MPQLKAAQELLFTSNPERGVKSTKFSENLVNV